MAAVVNVGEEEFDLVATAALAAHGRGAWKDAAGLDKLARKINAALSSRTGRKGSPFASLNPKALTWQDVESVLPAKRVLPIVPTTEPGK